MNNPKSEYIKYRINKSKEVFGDAVILANNNRWNSCINRLYYSSFYLASALLFKLGISVESHNGVKTQLFMEFVKTGKLSKAHGKLYSHLFDWRQDSDYTDFREFEESFVAPLLQEVREFNEKLLMLISETK